MGWFKSSNVRIRRGTKKKRKIKYKYFIFVEKKRGMLESVQEREMPKHLIGGRPTLLSKQRKYLQNKTIYLIYSILYNLLIKLY